MMNVSSMMNWFKEKKREKQREKSERIKAAEKINSILEEHNFLPIKVGSFGFEPLILNFIERLLADLDFHKNRGILKSEQIKLEVERFAKFPTHKDPPFQKELLDCTFPDVNAERFVEVYNKQHFQAKQLTTLGGEIAQLNEELLYWKNLYISNLGLGNALTDENPKVRRAAEEQVAASNTMKAILQFR